MALLALLDFTESNLFCCVDSPSASIVRIINKQRSEESDGHMKQLLLGNNKFVYFISMGMVVQSVIRLTTN